MAGLCFLRHGPRADLVNEPPLDPSANDFDPLVTASSLQLADGVADRILDLVSFEALGKYNFYVHFSPYLRCCQSADLTVSAMLAKLKTVAPDSSVKILLLCDFALSEWIHDRMKNKPPYIDSTEAYQMYTPNVQKLKNRKFVSNFRPTTKLGPWNESDLSFKEFLERCKTYFKKLLATYDNDIYRNDMIVVITHGYVVSNALSYFINHPVFDEIPEFGFNYASKESGQWVLEKDCLGILERDPNFNGALNLETDIVYYKTNFIKKDDFNPSKQYPALGFSGLKTDEPRPSFKIKSTRNWDPLKDPKALCSGARDWDPQDSNKFRIRAEFKKKVMQDNAFKRAFSIENKPLRPISPEVSPSLAPTRSNSTVNLSKLHSNEEIYRPLKLRYLLASDIPVSYLNLKLSLLGNLHLSLLHFGPKSSNGLNLDLAGPGLVELTLPRDKDDEGGANMSEVILRLSRVRLLQRQPYTSTPKFGVISENGNANLAKFSERSLPVRLDSCHGSETSNKVPFGLQFNSSRDRVQKPVAPRPVLTATEKPNSETRNVFYSFSPTSDSEDLADDKEYLWFGQNIKK